MFGLETWWDGMDPFLISKMEPTQFLFGCWDGIDPVFCLIEGIKGDGMIPVTSLDRGMGIEQKVW